MSSHQTSRPNHHQLIKLPSIRSIAGLSEYLPPLATDHTTISRLVFLTPTEPHSPEGLEPFKKLKRQQAVRACLFCKTHHVACSHHRPCLRCAGSGRQCVDVPSRRGLRARLRNDEMLRLANLGARHRSEEEEDIHRPYVFPPLFDSSRGEEDRRRTLEDGGVRRPPAPGPRHSFDDAAYPSPSPSPSSISSSCSMAPLQLDYHQDLPFSMPPRLHPSFSGRPSWPPSRLASRQCTSSVGKIASLNLANPLVLLVRTPTKSGTEPTTGRCTASSASAALFT